MAALGFADDIIKLRRRRSLGVSGRTKLLVQAIAAIGLWIVVKEKVGLNDSLDLQRGRRQRRARAAPTRS